MVNLGWLMIQLTCCSRSEPCAEPNMIMKPLTAYIKLKHKIMLLIEFKQIKAERN